MTAEEMLAMWRKRYVEGEMDTDEYELRVEYGLAVADFDLETAARVDAALRELTGQRAEHWTASR